MRMIVCSTLYGKKKLVAMDKISVRRGVYAVIVHEERILLVRLGHTGKYWFPGGGLEAGETLAEALSREVYEETGLTVALGDVVTEVENHWYDDTCDQAFKTIGIFVRCQPLPYELSITANPDAGWEQPEWVVLNALSEDAFQDYGAEIAALIRRDHQ